MTTAPEIVDTLRTLETPEGVELTMRVAGPYPRALAWLVDLGLRIGIYVVLAIVFVAVGASRIGGVGIGLFLTLVFLLEWFWSIGAEVWFGGASPGKRYVGLRVVRTDGLPVGLTESLLRNLLRPADFLPVFYGVGLIASLTSARFQRLGDRVAGTMVVHVDPPPRPRRPPSDEVFSPPVHLRSSEIEAITEFAERASGLTKDRSIEIADRLAGLTGATGEEGVRRLRGIASWAEGGRAS